ncbi:MAG TPA: hypothetical protein VL099_08895 [Candidatus Binatia bacterium]|nr:hypothetical protein [Candidatus Binatia bacterium]
MPQTVRARCLLLAVVSLAVALLPGSGTGAQDRQKPEEYQAQAFGQGTQLGQTFNVTVIIYEYSLPEDQQILIKSFEAAGMQGLVNALSKMRAKGHISITGTLGYDVGYVRSFPTADGRKIRLITNRPITFGEAWWDTGSGGNSMSFNLSALELNIDQKDQKKGTGTLLPACQFQINKDHELEIANLQNPWKLTDILQRK